MGEIKLGGSVITVNELLATPHENFKDDVFLKNRRPSTWGIILGRLDFVAKSFIFIVRHEDGKLAFYNEKELLDLCLDADEKKKGVKKST